VETKTIPLRSISEQINASSDQVLKLRTDNITRYHAGRYFYLDEESDFSIPKEVKIVAELDSLRNHVC
jgi:hypothetical protein